LSIYNTFLKWWLLITSVFVSGYFAYDFGVFELFYEKDITRLSFVITFLFLIASTCCGIKSFQISKILKEKIITEGIRKKIRKIEKTENLGWFLSDICLTIGMIGTVIGFIIMLVGFGTTDVSDSQSIQNLMGQISSGMSTSLLSTLAGLVCSVLLKLQFFNLSQSLNEVRDK